MVVSRRAHKKARPKPGIKEAHHENQSVIVVFHGTAWITMGM